ncbi:hypothetical protein EDC01DRAFT_666559 [Geopyxis carbonaria]|nr:hypothetical protein EDC01DRAFT_666559 [Geopyxis carbonaria]
MYFFLTVVGVMLFLSLFLSYLTFFFVASAGCGCSCGSGGGRRGGRVVGWKGDDGRWKMGCKKVQGARCKVEGGREVGEG